MNDHDLLIKISKDVEYIKKMLEMGEKRFEDHEQRIRNLENFKSKIAAVSAFVAFVISILSSILSRTFGK